MSWKTASGPLGGGVRISHSHKKNKKKGEKGETREKTTETIVCPKNKSLRKETQQLGFGGRGNKNLLEKCTKILVPYDY